MRGSLSVAKGGGRRLGGRLSAALEANRSPGPFDVAQGKTSNATCASRGGLPEEGRRVVGLFKGRASRQTGLALRQRKQIRLYQPIQ
jgi:hypothetical protein